MEVKRLKKLLRKYQIRPSKRLGQNFLIDKEVVRKIIEAAELKPEDVVLEIGPGIGALTIELAKRVKRVITIEKDLKMIEVLRETLKDFGNIEIIQGDILKLKFQIANSKIQIPKIYKIVANLPYYIVSPVIHQFLENTQVRPVSMVLMVQKEVGQRICAKPPEMSILAVSVQFYAQPEIISYVSKKSFWPQPKVDSAIIKIIPKLLVSKAYGRAFYESFFKIVRAGFSQPRKQLINNLSRLNFSSKNLRGQAKNPKLNRERVKSWLLKNNIQPTQRAETLTIEDWISLTESCRIE